jgi:hypothetical protein
MRPAECCFRLTSVCYSLPVRCMKRAPVTPVKEETSLGNRKVGLLSIRSSVFRFSKAIGGPFPCLSEMRESQIRVEDTLSIFNFSKLATETWLSVFWKRLFQAFFCGGGSRRQSLRGSLTELVRS